jgi:hypothetical protein
MRMAPFGVRTVLLATAAGGTSGAEWRRSITTNKITARMPMKAAPHVVGASQPCSGAEVIAKISEIKPSVTATAPPTSIDRGLLVSQLSARTR